MGLFLGSPFCSIDWYLCLCQYHAVLITVTLKYRLKSGSMVFLVLFFFLKIVLAIWDLLCFHTNFKIICSRSEKNPIGILIGIQLNLYMALESMAILAILILPIQNHSVSVNLFLLSSVSFISFLTVF